MHRCGYREEMEKCPAYQPKCELHGRVNMICIWFRKDFWDDDKNGGSICTKSMQKGVTEIYERGST